MAFEHDDGSHAMGFFFTCIRHARNACGETLILNL